MPKMGKGGCMPSPEALKLSQELHQQAMDLIYKKGDFSVNVNGKLVTITREQPVNRLQERRSKETVVRVNNTRVTGEWDILDPIKLAEQILAVTSALGKRE
jgi:hypothetical protein